MPISEWFGGPWTCSWNGNWRKMQNYPSQLYTCDMMRLHVWANRRVLDMGHPQCCSGDSSNMQRLKTNFRNCCTWENKWAANNKRIQTAVLCIFGAGKQTSTECSKAPNGHAVPRAQHCTSSFERGTQFKRVQLPSIICLLSNNQVRSDVSSSIVLTFESNILTLGRPLLVEAKRCPAWQSKNINSIKSIVCMCM